MSGLAATAAVSWLYDSDALSARVVRGVFQDAERDLVRPPTPDLSHWSDKSVDFCWIGHATVLINFYGLKVLTDPVLFDRVGASTPFGTVGRKRLVAPAIPVKGLPKLDLVLLSHAHMDHIDIPSLEALPHATQLLTAGKTTDLAREAGFRNINELRWGEKTTLTTGAGDISLEAFEVNHWGARWKTDSYRGYNGYLLSRGGKTLLFGGDTALCETFKSLGNRKIEAAIMPVGSYGRGSGHHCTPEEAVKMTDACKSPFIIPIHHSTFPLGKEPLEEPIQRLEEAISADRIALKKVGQTWSLPT
jgi:L-ascorbate metabolism protein UlaG (beta-lactamase superfamily)